MFVFLLNEYPLWVLLPLSLLVYYLRVKFRTFLVKDSRERFFPGGTIMAPSEDAAIEATVCMEYMMRARVLPVLYDINRNLQDILEELQDKDEDN